MLQKISPKLEKPEEKSNNFLSFNMLFVNMEELASIKAPSGNLDIKVVKSVNVET